MFHQKLDGVKVARHRAFVRPLALLIFGFGMGLHRRQEERFQLGASALTVRQPLLKLIVRFSTLTRREGRDVGRIVVVIKRLSGAYPAVKRTFGDADALASNCFRRTDGQRSDPQTQDDQLVPIISIEPNTRKRSERSPGWFAKDETGQLSIVI